MSHPLQEYGIFLHVAIKKKKLLSAMSYNFQCAHFIHILLELPYFKIFDAIIFILYFPIVYCYVEIQLIFVY